MNHSLVSAAKAALAEARELQDWHTNTAFRIDIYRASVELWLARYRYEHTLEGDRKEAESNLHNATKKLCKILAIIKGESPQ